MTNKSLAALFADELAVDVQPDDYDIGYWMRYAGRGRPRDKEARRGWDQCDKELRSEEGTDV